MPVKVKIEEPSGTYFITFTCYKWLHLIEKTMAYNLVYKWFDHLVEKGHFIIGFVIMPNHVHSIISFRNTDQSINTIVGNGKRFIAYEIINRLKTQGEIGLLKKLEIGVTSKDKLKNKKHEIWESSFDWKNCQSNAFIEQKLNYIHNNPCTEKWNLAKTPEEYKHSSAKYYICSVQGEYNVTNYLEIPDKDFGNGF